MTEAEFAEPLQQIDRLFVRSRGRKLLYFGGCDYHRLNSDPDIVRAVHTGLDRYGLSTAASRKTTGNHPLYEFVENRVRDFFQAEAAVLLSSGYLGNLAVAQALRREIDHAFVDERSHGSLQEAVQALGCRIQKFAHCRSIDLKEKLRRISKPERTVIVSDGMFAYDGSFAPLTAYRAAAGSGALLWVDDAHAAGVLGRNGRGSIEFSNLSRKRVIQTVTFSKAFGVYGGAIICDQAFRRKLIANSSAISGNTPLPLPFAFAISRALRHLNQRRVARLRERISEFWKIFGRTPTAPLSPIIAMYARKPKRLSSALLDAGIFPTLIHYPGGPEEGYFRFALSSEHTPAQIAKLATLLRHEAATPLNP